MNRIFFVPKLSYAKPMVVCVLYCFLLSCKSSKTENEAQNNVLPTHLLHLTDQQLSSIDLEIGSLSKQTLSPTVQSSGYIEVPPQNLYSISSRMNGFVHYTSLLPGLRVTKGQVLATLEGASFIQLQKDFLVAKAQLELLESEYHRQKALFEQQAISEKVYQKAKADWLSTKASYHALFQELKLNNIDPEHLTEETLSHTINIYAPFDGMITKVNTNVGQNITPDRVLFELINLSHLHLTLRVFEQDLNVLRLGQKVIAYTNAAPEKKHIASVVYITKEISEERTSEVHCDFENDELQLTPGMFMNALIETEAQSVFAVPESAVVNFEANDYLFVQKDTHTFELVAVQAKTKNKGWVELGNYLPLKDAKIVTKGAYTLLMSLKNTADEG